MLRHTVKWVLYNLDALSSDSPSGINERMSVEIMNNNSGISNARWPRMVYPIYFDSPIKAERVSRTGLCFEAIY